MTPLALEVVDGRAAPHAAVPTIELRVAARVPEAAVVHALVLRAQVHIEPHRRRYDAAEADRLVDLFGEPARWGETLRSFVWTHAVTAAPGFTGATTIDLPLACTYDFEVAAAKYLHALDGGEIPLVVRFSGTLFPRPAGGGFGAEPLSWDLEARYRLPVAVWREVMDRYFPGSGWVRVPRETLDRLQRYRVAQALPSWEQAIDRLLEQAEALR